MSSLIMHLLVVMLLAATSSNGFYLINAKHLGLGLNDKDDRTNDISYHPILLQEIDESHSKFSNNDDFDLFKLKNHQNDDELIIGYAKTDPTTEKAYSTHSTHSDKDITNNGLDNFKQQQNIVDEFKEIPNKLESSVSEIAAIEKLDTSKSSNELEASSERRRHATVTTLKPETDLDNPDDLESMKIDATADPKNMLPEQNYWTSKGKIIKNTKRDIDNLIIPAGYKVNTIVDKLRDETSIERHERVSRAMEKFVQLLSVVGKIDSYVSSRLKNGVKRIAGLYEDDSTFTGL